MNSQISSSTFFVLTIIIDLVILAVVFNGILPFRVSALGLTFGLFVISPAIAYIAAEVVLKD